jgi:hypothetical protein
MTIVHRVTLGRDCIAEATEIDRLGGDAKLFRASPSSSNWPWIFEIAEGDNRQDAVEGILSRLQSKYVARETFTRFLPSEYDASSAFVVTDSWVSGYPEPSKLRRIHGVNMLPEYFERTFDLSKYCPVCHAGAVQKSPFVIAKSPNWRTRSLMRLNWINDQIFVKRDVYEAVFRSFGIQSVEVLLAKGLRRDPDTIQLRIESKLTFDHSNLVFTTCLRCGTNKYRPVTRGQYILSRVPSEGVSHSLEWFGHSDAWRLVVFSKSVFDALSTHRLRGLDCDPCAERE